MVLSIVSGIHWKACNASFADKGKLLYLQDLPTMGSNVNSVERKWNLLEDKGDCSHSEALMLTPFSRINSVVHSVYVEVVICFITSNFDIRIWLMITGCWLHNSISEHTCGHKDSLKVKMST